MSTVAVIIRVMPNSPEADIELMKKGIQETLEKEGSQNFSFQTEDIAFGLKAIIVKFAWLEEKDTDIIEKNVSEVENVSSVKIEDYRRAFG